MKTAEDILNKLSKERGYANFYNLLKEAMNDLTVESIVLEAMENTLNKLLMSI